jgi:hypothetical protein
MISKKALSRVGESAFSVSGDALLAVDVGHSGNLVKGDFVALGFGE